MILDQIGKVKEGVYLLSVPQAMFSSSYNSCSAFPPGPGSGSGRFR